MQRVFKKIRNRIAMIATEACGYNPITRVVSEVELKEIISQIEKENDNQWIPVTEKYPEDDKYILLSFKNFSVPVIGRYEQDENGGAFYAGDEDVTLVSQDLFVNAWQPLPEIYKSQEEK